MGRNRLLAPASLLAIGAAAWTFQAYRRDLERARKAARTGSVLVDTAAGPIEYAERGAGPPLLSIHGAGGGFDQGLANAATFLGEDYRVIAPSRFGYLRTPVPRDSSAAAQADAHAALLARLGVDKAIVLGISAGARSALEMALRHPQRVSALILAVPGTYAPTSPVTVEDSRSSRLVLRAVNAGADFFWWALSKVAPSVLVRFVGVPPALAARASAAEREEVMALVRSIEPLSLRQAGINLDSAEGLHPLPLEKVVAPTLILSARDDLFNTAPAAEHAASRIPKARLQIFDTGGHLLVGRGAEVKAVVREFLAGAKRAGSAKAPPSRSRRRPSASSPRPR